MSIVIMYVIFNLRTEDVLIELDISAIEEYAIIITRIDMSLFKHQH